MAAAEEGDRGDTRSNSRKTAIIKMLFEERWDARHSTLTRSLVTLDEVVQAIRRQNLAHPNVPGKPKTELSDRNPANFLKDFIRKRRSANQNWPKSVLERGYTARQRTGGNSCFEFVPLAEGQTEPFPDRTPAPTEKTPRFQIESISLPLASRRLGRGDEPWLVQVLVRLRVIETHLALVSKRRVLQLDHLQMSVKLRESEIDALFLATEASDDNPDRPREVIVCCEAKGLGDDILEHQLLGHVQAAFKSKGVTQDLALPIAVKAIGTSKVHVIEFDVVARADAADAESLSIVSDAVFELVPPVPGIGK